MKAKLEWRETGIGGSVVWRQVSVEVQYSRNGNYWFKHLGIPYVFARLTDGCKVVAKLGDKWIEAGRVTNHVIFLGSGESYSEHNERMFLNEKWLTPVMP